jgi:pimeloyl-ACP methyl ester carboxylesterase
MLGLRTITELLEPIGVIARKPSLLSPVMRGGGTVFDETIPPIPSGCIEEIEGRQIFYRDTGPPPLRPKGTLLLLHGWLVPSDPHWLRTWRMLQVEGFRVLAIDARGHGHGPRFTEPFRLEDCAEDAAALLRYLDCGPVIAVGYSMGGLLAQLLARDHPELLSGAVFCASGCEFQTNALMRGVWQGMGLFQLWLRLAPEWTWSGFVELLTAGNHGTTSWVVSELRRGAASDIAEAGRDIGRFDSRSWVDGLDLPSAVVLTTLDVLVPPARQRELAYRLEAPIFELESGHLAPATAPYSFNYCLLEALNFVRRQRLRVAGTSSVNNVASSG